MAETELAGLAEQAKRGDRRAFERLVSLTARAVYAHVVSRVRDRQKAEDLVQDTFVAAWKGIASLEQIGANGSGFLGWLMTLFFLPPFLYQLLCEIFLNGQSVGKKLLRLKVIAADGGQPSISQYLIRWLFLTIDIPSAWIIFAISVQAIPWWWIIFIFSGLICVIVTPYSQRIGDLVAGTILIDTRSHT